MSVNELQGLTQKFAEAFDQRDLQPVMEMLSEDVEVFDHVPLSVRRQAALRQVSPRGRRGPCLSELRLPATIVSRVRRYRRYRKCLRHVYGRNQRRQGPVHPRPNDLGLPQTERAVEDCPRSSCQTGDGTCLSVTR
jgi:hypothetical protein